MSISKPILYMLISTLSFAFMNTFVKYLEGYSVFQLVFFRSIGTLVITMSLLMKNKIPILGNQRKLLVVRSLVGLTSMGLFFMGIQEMPVGTAVSLRNLSPIFAGIFAMILLKERIYPLQFLFFAIAFFGVVLIKGLDFRVSNLGILYTIGSAILGGLVYIIINKIGNKDHPLVIVNCFMLIATVVGGTLAILDWKQPHGLDWLLLLSMGLFGFFGQLFMTKSFQSAETNIIAPFKYMEVVFVLIIGLAWFGERHSLWSLLGISLVIFGLILNVLYKRRTKV